MICTDERPELGHLLRVGALLDEELELAHAVEDGGSRELAYVKMSRAKERSTVDAVADSIEQAKEDLRRDWGPTAGSAGSSTPARR